MKRCPTCNRAYYDETLFFCTEDGTPLSPPPSTEETQILPQEYENVLAPTVPVASYKQAQERARVAAPMPTIPVAIPTPPVYPAQSGAPFIPQTQAPAVAAQRRTRSGLIWLLLILVIVSLTIIAVVLGYTFSNRQSVSNENISNTSSANAGNKNKSEQTTATNSATTSSTTSATPSSEQLEYGYIKGTMTYPSEGIPGVMVACAENTETKETTCTNKRGSWQRSVSYSLKLPPGKYYVYGTILAGDENVAGMTGKRAYYTEYIRCGQAESCKSHARIPLDVTAGEALNGILLGDWWATTTNTSSTADSESERERAQAIESVKAILRKNAASCKISKINSITASPTANGWRVTASVVMAASGTPLNETAVWNVTKKNGTQPADQLTFEIGRGCF